MTDLFDVPPDPARPERKPKVCRRHDWGIRCKLAGGWNGCHDHLHLDPAIYEEWACRRCGKVKDPTTSRRSKNNKNRGLAIQRKRIEGLGGTNLAGNNENLDGIGLAFAYESKSGGSFSERYWRWLSGIPVKGDQTAVLIVTETPGPGRRARSYVVVEYDQWRDLHGEDRGEVRLPPPDDSLAGTEYGPLRRNKPALEAAQAVVAASGKTPDMFGTPSIAIGPLMDAIDTLRAALDGEPE